MDIENGRNSNQYGEQSSTYQNNFVPPYNNQQSGNYSSRQMNYQ